VTFLVQCHLAECARIRLKASFRRSRGRHGDWPNKTAFTALEISSRLSSLEWKTKHKGFPHELTCEEWRLPDGEDLLEVSIKVGPDQSATRSAFEPICADWPRPGGHSGNQPPVALEHMVQRLKPAG